MPTEMPKITFIVAENVENRIDDFRFSNRVKIRSEAIRQFIEKGLIHYEIKSE